MSALPATSLDLEVGESIAITGPSGAGKSTLLAIAGLLTRPNGGEVRIGGLPAPDGEGERARVRGEQIGFVFQSFNLFEHLSALDNVVAGLTHARRAASPATGSNDGRHQAMAALAEVGLADRARHRPSELSGGEQQRVAIARAIVKRPDLILADEPTGNLDDVNAELICQLLLGVARRGALMLVTHDATMASRCDRVVDLGSPLRPLP